jgi:hypothetical protein
VLLSPTNYDVPVFFAEQVFKPKIAYNGQKLTRLVRISMAPAARETIPAVPARTLPK